MTASPKVGVFSQGYRGLATAILLITGLVAFEGLSVTAALPEIGAALGSVHLLPWVITAYMVASGLALAVAGPVIDAVGPRKVFRVATLGFVAASLLCGLTNDMVLLIGARVVQGAAGGIVMSTSSSAIGLGYPESVRSRAYAMASTVWGVLAFGGPAVAAALLTAADWRWIFLSNVPLALCAAVAGWRAIPGPPEGPQPLRVDGLGAFLLFVLVSVGLLGVSRLDRVGAAALLVTGVVGGLYWWHSGRAESPVLARRHFARAPFGGLAGAAALVMGAGIGVETYLPLYLRATRGVGIAFAAWSVLFLTVGWTLGANVASRLYTRIDERRMTVVGTLLMAPVLGLAALAVWWQWPLWSLFVLYTLAGLSIGAVTNACLTLVQFCAEPREVGRATTAHQFLRTMAATAGTALAGAVLFAVTTARGGNAESVRALLGGEHALGEAPVGPEVASGLASGFAIAHLLAMAVGIVGIWVSWRSSRALADPLRAVEDEAL